VRKEAFVVCVCVCVVCMCVCVFKIIIASHTQEATLGALTRDLKNATPKRASRLPASDGLSSTVSATCPSPTDRGRGGETTTNSGLNEDQGADQDGTGWARIKREDPSVVITRAWYVDDTQASDDEQCDPASRSQSRSQLPELSPRLSVTDSCNSRVTLRLSVASSETSSRTLMRAPCSMCGVRVRGATADEASGKIYCTFCMELLKDMAHIRLSAALHSSDSNVDSPSQSSLRTPTEGDEVAQGDESLFAACAQDDEGAGGKEAAKSVSGVRAMFAAMFVPRSKGSSPATPRGTPFQTRY